MVLKRKSEGGQTNDIPRTINREDSKQLQQAALSTNLGATLGLCSLAVAGVSLLTNMIVMAKVGALESKPLPVLMQAADGSRLGIKAQFDLQRSPELLKNFARVSMGQLYSWQPYLIKDGKDLSTAKKDPGVPVTYKSKIKGGSGGTINIPTPAYLATLRLSNDFRDSFIASSLAPLLVSAGITQGTTVTTYIVDAIEEPVLAKDIQGRAAWTIGITGAIVVRTPQGAKTVPHNVIMTVRAVPPPVVPPTQPDGAGDLAYYTALERSDGLAIEGIENYKKTIITTTTKK